ncbi:PAS domain-containing protein [Bernardetia sp. Wsw4-3y2]|uniref:PAS domain-containing protein n=1 Tax=Bernardetia sp. Wsw4-3y2 TaxID=3127471 RepID=UPI0030CF3E34
MNYLKQEFYQILKSDEDFFDFVQLNAFDGLWFWNLEKPNDKWINPKFCNLLGYEYEELQGNQIQKIVHPEDVEKINTIFLSYKTTNSSTIYENEIRFFHKNGTTLWVKMKALIFGSPEENNHRVVVTHTNTTTNHQQEVELIRIVNRYESMLNHNSVFIIRTDLEGKYTYVNNHFCDRLGLDKREIIGQSAMSAILVEDHEKYIEAVHKCFASPNDSVFVHLRKPIFDRKTQKTTSQYIYSDWECKLILNKDGIAEEIQCIGIEVTDKVMSEKEKDIQTKELIQTQKLLNTCNSHAKIGIWNLDLKTGIVQWDKIARNIHEVDKDFVIHNNGIEFYQEKDKARIEKVGMLALTEGKKPDEEFEIITYKGNKRWIRVIGIPVMENGSCIEFYGTIQDITSQKQAELQIKEKLKELEIIQKELIHTQQILKTCNENTRVGVWMLDLKTRLVKWDKIIREIHEVDENFIVDDKIGISFYKDKDQEKIKKNLDLALEKGISYDDEFQFVTNKGNKRWVRSTGVPTMENGVCVELYGTFQDITEKKEIEIQLKEKISQLEATQNKLIHTQKLLDTSNEAAKIGTWQLNLDDFTTTWNKVTKEIHQVENDFVSNAQNGIEFYKEGYSREKITEVFKKAFEEGMPFDEQLIIITAKGNEKWVRTIGIPTFENRKCIEMYGTFQDITTQKEAELEIKEKVEELQTTQNRLIHTQKLLDASNEAAKIGTWELNIDDFSTNVDKITRQIHQVDDNFLWNVDNAILFYKEGYSREKITEVFKKAFEEGIPYDEQLKIVTAKGNEVWIRTIGIPTLENGKCVELYGTFQDITAQKEAESEIKQKIDELEITQHQLIHTQKLLDASNEAAQIGTWELNLNNQSVLWDKVTKSIHEVDTNFITTIENGIEFYTEGYSRETITNLFKKAVEEGIPFDKELKIITAKGNKIWVRVIGVPTFENGKCVELYGTTQNIDKQKRNEIILQQKIEELEVSQNDLLHARTLLETCNANAVIGVWEFDLETRVNKVDKIIRQIHEVDNNYESSIDHGLESYHEEDRKVITDSFNNAINSGISFDKQLRITTHKGNKKWVRVIGIPKIEQGKTIELYGLLQDITLQKNAETQLKEKVNELEKAKQETQKIQNKLSTTLEKTGIGIWEVDLLTGRTYWDKQIRKMFGVNEFEEINNEIASSKIHEDDLVIMNKMLEDLIMEKIPTYHMVYRVKLSNKTIKYYDSKVILIKNEVGKPISVFGVTQDITKEKQAELKIQEKVTELQIAQQEIQSIQVKLSTTLEKTGIGLWEIDLITNQPYLNKQARILFGISEHEEINSGSISKRVHPNDIARVNELLADLVTQRVLQYQAIYRTVPIDGKIRYHEGKAILIKDEKGNPISILGVTQDITIQKEHENIIEEQNQDLAKSEQELRKGIREMYHLQKDLETQKQQLEQIFDAVPAMIYQFKRDKEGYISFPLVSKGSEFVLGVTPQEMQNNSSNDIFESIHPEDLLGFQSSGKKSADTMQKWESELRLIKNEKEVWIHATSKPTRMDDGSILWTGIMQNIDQLKENELKIQKQNQELQETLDELRTTQSQLIHNEKMTTLGQLVASIAHEINTPLGAISSSAGTIFKLLKDSLSNLPKIIKTLTEQQLEGFNILIEKSMETNKLYSSREKRAIKYKLIAEFEDRNIYQADRIADILVDTGLNEYTELYEPFLELPKAVEFFHSIYEISTIMKSNTTVRIATEKASKIIITLKNFSRQDHTGEKKPTSINESLENTLILYQNKLKYGIEVIREMEDLPLINAYEDELAQVWTNLLHNAIQAIDTSKNKKGKIYMTTKKQENKILVSVRDTGKGVPDEVKQKIFDAFFTTKPVGEGSGLGLNIVRKIIEKHDGKIWFETENIGENTGTTFFVELPIK